MRSDARFKVAYFTDILVLVEVVSYAVAAMVVDAEIVTSSTFHVCKSLCQTLAKLASV